MMAKAASSSVPCTPSPRKEGQIQRLQGNQSRGTASVDLDTTKENHIWNLEAIASDMAEDVEKGAGDSPRRSDFNTTESWYIKGHNKYPPPRRASLVSAKCLFDAGAHSPII